MTQAEVIQAQVTPKLGLNHTNLNDINDLGLSGMGPSDPICSDINVSDQALVT